MFLRFFSINSYKTKITKKMKRKTSQFESSKDETFDVSLSKKVHENPFDKNRLDVISIIPLEISFVIIEWLETPWKKLLQLRLVCKNWKRILDDWSQGDKRLALKIWSSQKESVSLFDSVQPCVGSIGIDLLQPLQLSDETLVRLEFLTFRIYRDVQSIDFVNRMVNLKLLFFETNFKTFPQIDKLTNLKKLVGWDLGSISSSLTNLEFLECSAISPGQNEKNLLPLTKLRELTIQRPNLQRLSTTISTLQNLTKLKMINPIWNAEDFINPPVLSLISLSIVLALPYKTKFPLYMGFISKQTNLTSLDITCTNILAKFDLSKLTSLSFLYIKCQKIQENHYGSFWNNILKLKKFVHLTIQEEEPSGEASRICYQKLERRLGLKSITINNFSRCILHQ